MSSRHASHDRSATGVCALTGARLPLRDLVPFDALTPGLSAAILEHHPDLPHDALLARAEVSRRRNLYIREMLAAEHGELNALEAQVAASIANADTISTNVATAFLEKRTFAQRLSDGMASFVGSWSFIIVFLLVLIAWMAVNVALIGRAFDPYPFILLNLVLSCIAAIQAPIIMMSQQRQEAKDRLRSENDYRVNLKAELEIRNLHEKMDHLLSHQWQRLAEIQQMQIEIMEDRARDRTPPAPPPTPA
ncbi:MAG: DUF1003 domain-containing protein [Siculibacillus sp.]